MTLHPTGTITIMSADYPVPEGYIHIPEDHWLRGAQMSLAPFLHWTIGPDPEGMRYVYCGPALPELPAPRPGEYSIGSS